MGGIITPREDSVSHVTSCVWHRGAPGHSRPGWDTHRGAHSGKEGAHRCPHLLGPHQHPPRRSPALSRSRSSGSHWRPCSSLSRARHPGRHWPTWLSASASGARTGTPGTRCLPSAGGPREAGEKAQLGHTFRTAQEGESIPQAHFSWSLEDPWDQLVALVIRQGDYEATETWRGRTRGTPLSARCMSLPQPSRRCPGYPPSWSTRHTHLLQFTCYLFRLVILQTGSTDGEGPRGMVRGDRTQSAEGLPSGTI